MQINLKGIRRRRVFDGIIDVGISTPKGKKYKNVKVRP
jgi:hypothetical protein